MRRLGLVAVVSVGCASTELSALERRAVIRENAAVASSPHDMGPPPPMPKADPSADPSLTTAEKEAFRLRMCRGWCADRFARCSSESGQNIDERYRAVLMAEGVRAALTNSRTRPVADPSGAFVVAEMRCRNQADLCVLRCE